MWETFFFCVGLINVAYFLKAFVEFVYQQCVRQKLDLAQRYGKGSWALVTGASRGIGAEYCKQLARDGFNICMVSRTRANMESVAKEISTECPNVKTSLIQFDFEGATTMGDYEKLLS